MKKTASLLVAATALLAAGLSQSIATSPEVRDGKRRLEEALASARQERVQEAAVALSRLRTAEALEALLSSVTQDLDPNLYWPILAASGSFEGPDCCTILVDWIQNGSTPERAAYDLMNLLASRNYATASGVCYQVAQANGGRGEGRAVRAVRELGRLPPNMAVQQLTRLLEELPDSADEKRTLVISLLTEITGANAGSNAQLWRDSWDTRRQQTGQTGDTLEFLDDYNRARAPEPGQLLVVESDCPNRARGEITNFDHIDRALAQLNIPCRLVGKSEFDKTDFSLENVAMILINCHQFRQHCHGAECRAGGSAMAGRLQGCAGPGPHESRDHRLSDDGVQRVRAFVEGGGYLFSEDWILEDVLTRAWPDLVAVGPGLEEDIPGPEVFPAPGNASHPYLDRIFGEPGREGVDLMDYNVENVIEQARHHWKIDNESPEIDVKDAARVTTLLTTTFKNGHENCPVAVTFAPADRGGGRTDYYGEPRGGRVLHVLSHFGKQHDEADERSLQNLLVNFIGECMERRGEQPAEPAGRNGRNRR